ncbi:hypothetical protein LTR36_007143 [Oleoguttula mirabilis]|uniref:Myb-like domain-containing protein n=1 Tax=Oleoguttula mirabilis TaxID=1507867 RepID=A0AAV9JAF8_9PEZI|nr:hypothetical protein LTR36_007143 [Oleoguttula mirabilis]
MAKNGKRACWTEEEESTLLQAIKCVKGANWTEISDLHGPRGTESRILGNWTTNAISQKAVTLYKEKGLTLPASKYMRGYREGTHASSQQDTRRPNDEELQHTSLLRRNTDVMDLSGNNESEDDGVSDALQATTMARGTGVVAREDVDGHEDEKDVMLQLRIEESRRKEAELLLKLHRMRKGTA